LLDRIAWLLALEFALAVVSDLLGRAVSMIDGLLSERFSNETSLRLMEHAATLDLEDFEDSDMQDQLERARRQAAGRTSLIGQLFAQAQDVVTVVSFAAGLVVYAPWLIALLAIALVPAFVGEAHFNARSYSLNYARTPERRELDYVRQTGASAETAKEVKIFGLHRFLIERYRQLAQSFFLANRAIAMRRAGWGSVLSAIGTLAYYAAYAYIVWRTIHGDFTIGDLTFLSGSFRRLRNLLENLLLGFSSVAGQALYLDDLFSFFEIARRDRLAAEPAAVPGADPRRVRLRGRRLPLSRRRALGRARVVLHAPRRRDARAGRRERRGQDDAREAARAPLRSRRGRILLDGHDLREYDLDDAAREHRRHLPGLRALSPDARPTTSRWAHRGARRPRAHRERRGAASPTRSIAKLPAGYDQMLGKRFQHGVDLSGGEWQKIAIARAYMRDAQVLILDEPTAALDARAEFEVFQRFKELAEGKTAVLISHRFSSVRMADRIVVLKDGRVDAAGTHDELVAQDGMYAELFEMQAAGYR
jgi:ATP-binding cassette subfamily B protein